MYVAKTEALILRLYFRMCKKPVFSQRGSNVLNIKYALVHAL